MIIRSWWLIYDLISHVFSGIISDTDHLTGWLISDLISDLISYLISGTCGILTDAAIIGDWTTLLTAVISSRDELTDAILNVRSVTSLFVACKHDPDPTVGSRYLRFPISNLGSPMYGLQFSISNLHSPISDLQSRLI